MENIESSDSEREQGPDTISYRSIQPKSMGEKNNKLTGLMPSYNGAERTRVNSFTTEPKFMNDNKPNRMGPSLKKVGKELTPMCKPSANEESKFNIFRDLDSNFDSDINLSKASICLNLEVQTNTHSTIPDISKINWKDEIIIRSDNRVGSYGAGVSNMGGHHCFPKAQERNKKK